MEPDPRKSVRQPETLIVRYTGDAGHYLERVGVFLRKRPVEHSVLLSTVGNRAGTKTESRVGIQAGATGTDLWLWVEDDEEVVATAQHTPPHGAYLSTGPADAMRRLARTLWEIRPELPGVAGLDSAPQEFAEQWSRLGGPVATPAMMQGLYVADQVSIPSGVPGRLRLAKYGEASLLRGWSTAFFAEAAARTSPRDEIGPRIDAGLLFVWEVDETGSPWQRSPLHRAESAGSALSTPRRRTAGTASPAPASPV